jgi:hypothetical protein
MGAVFLGGTDGMVTPALNGLGVQSSGLVDDLITIPGAFASFPINAGLTSAGLSNWGTSAHSAWNSINTSLWTAINIGNSSDNITVVSAASAGGGTGGTAPEPSALALLCSASLSYCGYFGWRRRKQNVTV